MSEDEILKHLGQKQIPSGITQSGVSPRMRVATRKPQQQEAETFKDFSATHMLCPRCRQAMPVRQKIMLYLSDGDLYAYHCAKCGTSCGTRKVGR